MTPIQRFFRDWAACGCLLDVACTGCGTRRRRVMGALLVLAVRAVCV